MKNLFKRFSFFALLLVAAISLAGCFGGGGQENPGEQPGTQPGDDPLQEDSYLSLEDYKAYILADLEDAKEALGALGDKEAAVNAAYSAGQAGIQEAKSVAQVKEAFDSAKVRMANCFPLADGVFSYNAKSVEEKTEILGLLEAYAVRNGITGISLFENGGYVMYSDDVVLGTEQYIVGYGFGVLAEGGVVADLATENNEAWKRYYHTYNVADPGTANYLNDQGSEVGDFYGYIGASYYTTFMNEDKNGYDWVPELANQKPIAMNADEQGKATIWRIPVKTDELKYNTLSSNAERAAFNGRAVELEDYITPFKLLLTQANGLYRGAEFANQTTYGVKGAKTYYEQSAEGFNAEAWANVGLKTGVDAEYGPYLEVEFINAFDQFYAMYYITSSLYMPVPQEFLDLVTVEYYLGFNEDKSLTPVDNSLSLGAYTLERWDSQDQVVYKKNPYYVYADSKYATPGIHIDIFPAAGTDTEAGFNQFINGYIHASGIPQTKLEEYKNDPRTRTSSGDSNFKLNVNATDQETWEQLFGVNGIVTQTPTEKYWDVKPVLGNEHFVKALSLSIDRFSFAAKRGSIPAVDFLSSNYMSDPVGGIAYSATQAHKDAVAGLLENTDGYGFNLELARDYFKVALMELEAEGKLVPGTPEAPNVIELEIAWMYTTHEEAYHNEIKQYFEDAFNHESVSGGNYQLKCNFWVGNAWSDVYYNKMMVGQFDIGFGSVTGDPLNPLAFLNVLSSDQTLSGGFTLNWGTNTNDPEADALIYEGKRFSFDALWVAGVSTAIVADGANTPAISYELAEIVNKEDGSADVKVKVYYALMDQIEFQAELFAVWNYEAYYAGAEYYEEYPEFTQEATDYGCLITANVPAEMVAAFPGNIGFDIYYGVAIAGGDPSTGEYFSVYGSFE